MRYSGWDGRQDLHETRAAPGDVHVGRALTLGHGLLIVSKSTESSIVLAPTFPRAIKERRAVAGPTPNLWPESHSSKLKET